MALVLDFSISQCSDCTEFTFTDNTGIYNATTNPTGWGAPNPLLANAITPCTLDITFPSGTTYQIDLVTTSPVFPVDQAPNELTLDMSSFGGATGDDFPDGIYTFVYTVTVDDGTVTTYTQTVQMAFYCQVSCCVYSMFKDLDIECDCCEEDRSNIINAYLMLKGLIYSANCGNTSQFTSILTELQKICTTSNCENCR